jgi:hypothetical protein
MEAHTEGVPLGAGSAQHFSFTPWQSCTKICCAVPAVSVSFLLA